MTDNYRSGYLQQGSPMPMLTSSVLLTADDQILNPNLQTGIYIYSDSATVTARTFTLQNGLLPGQMLTLFFQSASMTAELLSTGNVKLIATWQALLYDTLTLRWDGTYWLEICRGNVGSVASGLGVCQRAIGVYDSTKGFTAGAHVLGPVVPINAFVSGAWYFVKTTFTSAADTATLAVSLQAANDIVSAIAIGDVTNPWDATSLPVEGISKVEDSSTWLRTTAARSLTVTTAVQTITAGSMTVWLDYVIIP